MRYENVTILKDNLTNRRYYRGVKYPPVPYNDEDIYIISVYGDRLDILSYDYYGTTDDYWIILTANNLPGDSLYVVPGTQIRIPSNTSDLKIAFDTLNLI
jgi:hypothetical protein